jgi:hypothetical protein
MISVLLWIQPNLTATPNLGVWLGIGSAQLLIWQTVINPVVTLASIGAYRRALRGLLLHANKIGPPAAMGMVVHHISGRNIDGVLLQQVDHRPQQPDEDNVGVRTRLFEGFFRLFNS